MIWVTAKSSKQQLTQAYQQLNAQIESYAGKIQAFLTEINTIILDKEQQTKLALSCLLAGGHVLFEDLPGLGKTTLSSALAALGRSSNFSAFSLPMTCWPVM